MSVSRLAFVAVLLFGAFGALAAPAEYAVEVGKRVSIRVAHPTGEEPLPKQLVPALQVPGKQLEVQVQVRRPSDGSLELQLDLWGDAVAPDLEQRVRAFPQLKDAQITVTALEGKVRTSVLGKLGHEVKGDSPAEREAARRALQAKLQAEHPDSKVEVKGSPDGREEEVVIKKQ